MCVCLNPPLEKAASTTASCGCEEKPPKEHSQTKPEEDANRNPPLLQLSVHHLPGFNSFFVGKLLETLQKEIKVRIKLFIVPVQVYKCTHVFLFLKED